MALDLQSLIDAAASRYGIAPDLLASVVDTESGGNPNAVSPKGAVGLMQLMPATADHLGVTNPYDPAENLDGGARYLRRLQDQFGDDALALAAYNAGPSRVRRAGGMPNIPETHDYVRKVMSGRPQFSGGQGVDTLTGSDAGDKELDQLFSQAAAGAGDAAEGLAPGVTLTRDGRMATWAGADGTQNIDTVANAPHIGPKPQADATNGGPRDQELDQLFGEAAAQVAPVKTPAQAAAEADVAKNQMPTAGIPIQVAAHDLTLGLSDVVPSAFAGAGAELKKLTGHDPGYGFADAYTARREALKANEDEFARERPWTNAGMAVAGAVATPGVGLTGKFIARGIPMLPKAVEGIGALKYALGSGAISARALRAGAAGVPIGAIAGAAQAPSPDQVGSGAASGAAWGGATGLVAEPAMEGLMRAGAPVIRQVVKPMVTEALTNAQDALKTVGIDFNAMARPPRWTS